MNCVLDTEQQELLLAKVYKDLSDHLSANKSFDFKDYATSFYNMVVEKSGDKALGVSYVASLPQTISLVVGLRQPIRKMLTPFLTQIAEQEAAFENIDFVSEFVSPDVDKIAELKEETEQAVKDLKNPTKTETDVLPVTPEPNYEPLPLSTLSDKPADLSSGIENERWYNSIKKRIITAAASKRSDGSVVLEGVGEVTLTLMHSTRIEDKHLRTQLQLNLFQPRIAEAYSKGVSLVVTDGAGNIIYFDEQGQRSDKEKGKPAYYNIIKGFYDADVTRLAKSNSISEKEARAILDKQRETANNFREYIQKNPQEHQIKMDILGGDFGTPVLNREMLGMKKQPTSISALGLNNTSFSPNIHGRSTWIELPGFAAHIELQKPVFTKELATKIASVLLDDLQVETESGNQPIEYKKRKELFEQFVFNKRETIDIYPSKTGTGAIVRILGTTVDVTNKEEARREIIEYLTKEKPTRIIEEKDINNRNVIKSSAVFAGATYKLNDIFEQEGDGKTPSVFYVVEPAKINNVEDLLKTGYFDFSIVGDVVTGATTRVSYVDFIRNNFTMFYNVDANNQIETVNPIVQFEPAVGEMEKITPENKEIIETAKTEVPKQSGLNNSEPQTDIDKLINDVRNDPAFDKLYNQETLKATKQQAEAAKVWYKKSPLAKHIPFHVMFLAVNQANSNSIASWRLNAVMLLNGVKQKRGITLYKGSDFSDLYHEAWHGFTQTFLTKEQKTSLYKEVKKKSGTFVDFNGKKVTFENATELQIEEYLAEDFREYMLSGGKVVAGSPARNTIFRKIWNFLKELFGGTTINEVAINDKANKTIHDLYKQLRVGDLTQYTFAVENANFNTLNKGIVSGNKDNPITSLSFADSDLLSSSVDALFSQFAEESNGGMTYKYSTSLFTTKAGIKASYKYVQIRFSEMRKETAAKLAVEQNVSIIGRLQKKLDTLDYALQEFGDVENIDKNKQGVNLIGYHLWRSPYLNPKIIEQKDNAVTEATDAAREELGKHVYDRGGVEVAAIQRAPNEILRMIEGLFKRNIKGEVELNDLDIPILAPINESFGYIGRVTKGFSTPQLMFEALKKESEHSKLIEQLLGKLGAVWYPGQSDREVDTWTKFWQAFNSADIPVVVSTLEKTTKNEEGISGPITYNFITREQLPEIDKVQNDWKNAFELDTKSKYIVNNGTGNFLDIKKVLTDFPTETDVLKKPFEFFRAIGIKFNETKEAEDALTKALTSKDIRVRAFLETLQAMQKTGFKMTSPLQLKFDFPKSGIKGVGGYFKKIAAIELRYGNYSDSMVSNAEGNMQATKSENTSLIVKVKKINEAKTLKELGGSNSPMQFLREEGGYNPWAVSSQWLKTLFDEAGDKIPGKKITVQNLGGVTKTTDGRDTGEGVQTADTDEFAKLIYDIHLQMEGMPGLPQNSDKGTYLSVGVGTKLLVPTSAFFATESGFTLPTTAIDIVLPYLRAELSRVNNMKRILDPQSGVEDYDWGFAERGSEFVLFWDMLRPETKKALHNVQGDLFEHFKTDAGTKLRGEVIEDLNVYFADVFGKIRNKFNESPYLSTQIVERVKKESADTVHKDNMNTEHKVQDAVLRSFAFNNWVHNVETSILFYGDLAQYNHANNDFQKRISIMNSTGTPVRNDPAFIKYVEERLGRPYAVAQEIDITNAGYDGVIHTAIVEDIEVPSVYREQYEKVIQESADAFGNVNEADAQGLIAFDMYRVISKGVDQWTPEQELLFQRIIKGEVSKDTRTDTFFPVLKFSYGGELLQGNKTLSPISAVHKFSLFPLLPGLGKNADALHKKMMTENIGYVTFKSGSKTGVISKRKTNKEGKSVAQLDRLYSDVKTRTLSTEPFVKNTIFPEFLKNQIKTQAKWKESIQFYTQARALIDNGMMENGVPTDFMEGKEIGARKEAWSKIEKGWNKLSEKEQKKISNRFRLRNKFVEDVYKLSEQKRVQFVQEIGGTTKDGKTTYNAEKLLKVISDELLRNDLAEHERAFFQLGKDGLLRFDGSMSLAAEKVEKVIQSLINRKLVRYGVNGEWLVQVASTGFENLDFAYGNTRNLEKPTEEDLKKYGTNDLPAPHIGKDGITRAGKAKIAMQGDFWKLLSDVDVLKRAQEKSILKVDALNELLKEDAWLDKGDNRRMVTIIAPRIPTQQHSSIEFLEVYEFLPSWSGNIIMTYSEITTKSGTDYDYDKLPVMMPHIQHRQGIPVIARAYTLKEARELYDKIKQANIAIADQEELRQKTSAIKPREAREDLSQYNNILNEMFGQDWNDLDAVLTEYLGEKQAIGTLEEFFTKLNGTQATENDILWGMKSILELPENFQRLIKPNSIETLEPIARELEPHLSEYNPANTVFGEPMMSKGKPVMSGTRALEYLHNLYTHSTNSAGKSTLGIGAVANKFHPLINATGLVLNPTRIYKNNSYRQTLELPHNSVVINGKKRISFSNSNDVELKNYIGDIISEAMNGWVDVASKHGAWINYIQGNKELTPVLLFLFKAGVPARHAALFLSQPIIRDYVTEQKKAKSPLAETFGKGITNKNFFRYEAKKRIFENPKYEFPVYDLESMSKQGNIYVDTKKQDVVTRNHTGAFKKAFDITWLKDNVVAYGKSLSDKTKHKYSDEDRTAFLHFLEIEFMSKNIGTINFNFNMDTSPPKNSYEAQTKKRAQEAIHDHGSFDASFASDLMGKTVLGAYDVSKISEQFAAEVFKVRIHPVLNKFLTDLTDSGELSKAAKNLYGDRQDAEQMLVTDFRNDLVSYIFQNAGRQFDVNTALYKGTAVNTEIPVADVQGLKFGAFVKEGKLYVDKARIKSDFETKAFSTDEYSEKGLGKLNANTFTNLQEYAHFVYEREVLRTMYKPADAATDVEYIDLLDRNTKNSKLHKEGETDETFADRVKRGTFAQWLSNKALDNTLNLWKMFKSHSSYADQFMSIKLKYPQLQRAFSVVFDLRSDNSKVNGLRNLKIADNRFKGKDGLSTLELYNENLLDLANSSKLTMIDSQQERDRIAAFFTKFPLYAFMQSGLNTKSKFSLVRMVPQDTFTSMMVQPMNDWEHKMSPAILQDVFNKFYVQNINRAQAIRSKDYLSSATLDKPTTEKPTMEQLEMFKELEVASNAGGEKVVKNENGLVIIDNAIDIKASINIVENAKDFIKATSYKQTQGAVSWGWGLQWNRINGMTQAQKVGLVIGKQLNGINLTEKMKDDIIKGLTPKGMPLYGYTEFDKNGKKLPNIPTEVINLLAVKGIDISEYDASYNSVYDKADNGSLIIHQDNTETNTSPIITISLGRPMQFITYELKDANDFNVSDSTNTGFRIAINAVSGEAIKLGLIPSKSIDKYGRPTYGHLTPNTVIKYAQQIDAKKGTKLTEFVLEKLKEQFKVSIKTEYKLTNGTILVFSGENRNVLHEIVFDETTDKEKMPEGFPVLSVNKAFKGLGHADRIVTTADYRVVITLRKVKGDAIKNNIDFPKLLSVNSNKKHPAKDQKMSYAMPAKDNLTGKDTSTLALVEQGLRTATTRSFPLGKIGDIITFEGHPQQYRITKVERLTDENTTNPEWVKQWSQKEQWTQEYYKSILNKKNTVKVGSYQTTFEKVEQTKPTKEKMEVMEAQQLEMFEDTEVTSPSQTEQIKSADVILPIGTSGSGKSTFIKSLPQENLVVISPDDMRVEFTGDINNKSKDKEIYIEAANRAVQAIKQGKQVVFDTTNLTKDKRRPFIEAIKKAIPTANIQYKLMELNPELAKQRIKAQIEEYNKAKKEADKRPNTTNIPQNLQSGVEQYGTLQYANNEAQKLLGKNVTSIELIENGFRTRTTRTDKELLKYDIKVGSYIKMFGKDQFGNTKNIIVKITKITKGYDDATWYKEGWTNEGLEKLKDHTNTANAVEFEAVINRANVPDSTIDRHAESYKQMLEDIKSEGITNYDTTQQSTTTTSQTEQISGFQGYKGGFENTGKGTPQGDGKDKAMRVVADGFIGEAVKENSSTYTSAKEISKKTGDEISWNSKTKTIFGGSDSAKVTMLARNSERKGKELNQDTKEAINVLSKGGSSFVVGDMPNVDSQFIDYLQKIGATFTVYHTGTASRINVTSSSQLEEQTKPTEVKPQPITDEEVSEFLNSCFK